ncbi:MAG: MBL fold metallo-hydrolase [Candidatus Magasanikbacteria bacterium]|nr:MBL fold metallo-hydrolase [Candidatus Magasanikbacteria bacterium]
MIRAIKLVFILLIITFGLIFYVRFENGKLEVRIESQNSVVNSKRENLRITFLDVGQGDASFIEFPTGEQMLIDCAVDSRILSALGGVMEFYDRDLDYLVVTHPDLDHYGGCEDILRRFQVKNIIYNDARKFGDPVWESFWQAVQNENAVYYPVNQPTVWQMGSSTMNFFYPDHSVASSTAIKAEQKETNDNNASVVFRLDYAGYSVLFTGDAENELEQYIINKYGKQLDSDVLKVGHHGSAGASGKLFLEAITPEYAVISVGADNDYGHPSLRVLKRLDRAGAKVFRTDLDGKVVFEISDAIKVENKK